MNILERVKTKAAGLLIPVGMHFDLTHRCHQRCVHCYLPETWRRGEGLAAELTTPQIKGILTQLAEAGTFLLTISGGEAFLRPDLLAILAHARRLQFSISLMTSGSWGIDPEGLRFLKDLGLQGMVVTLFSLTDQIHDDITGVKGSWERTMQTIRQGKALGLPMVVNCIAFPANIDELTAIKQFLAHADIPLRLDYVLLPRWDGRPHHAHLRLSPHQQSRLLDMFAAGDEDLPQEPGCALPDTPPGGCGAGWRGAYITPSGELWPCPEVPIVCGRLNGKQHFGDIWRESPGFQKIRAIMADPTEEVMLCKNPAIQEDLGLARAHCLCPAPAGSGSEAEVELPLRPQC